MHCRVLKANWPALVFFLGVQTQWRVLTGGKRLVYLGLDYTAVESTMRMEGIRNRTAMLGDLRVMETVALILMNDGVLKDDDYPGEPAWQD